jgi:hypothetical protein
VFQNRVEVPTVQDADETAHNLTKGIQLEQSSSCVLNANTHLFFIISFISAQVYRQMLLNTVVCVFFSVRRKHSRIVICFLMSLPSLTSHY